MDVFLFNTGCIGRHVTSSFSTFVTTASETFYFKIAEAIAVFLKVNVIKIKCHRTEACKKNNLTYVSGMDRSICPSGHSLVSRGEPRDANL